MKIEGSCEQTESRSIATYIYNTYFYDPSGVAYSCTYAVVERNRINDHESIEVVFEGDVIPVPSHHVERTMVLLGGEQLTLVLANYLVIGVSILVPCHRRFEVPWIRQAVCTCVETVA